MGGNIYIPPLPDLSRFYPDISRYFLSGGHSGIIRIYKIGQGSVGGNIYIPPLPDLSRYFQNFSQGGGKSGLIWIMKIGHSSAGGIYMR